VAEACDHLDSIHDVAPASDGCEDCLRIGASWVHLRQCMTCGHIGCCDESPNRHATAHWRSRQDHPIIRSFEPDETWYWCYPDELTFELEGELPPAGTDQAGA
jgi:uncharacterized UBP type Zn finger protein